MKTPTLNNVLTSLAVASAMVLPVVAQAQATPWMVRVRALNLDSANKDSTPLGLTVNNKVIPEVDISYFFSPEIAAELVLTYPQKHRISSNGTEIGSLKHLPPTLSLQYHVPGMGAIKPYAGLGLNYTHFSGVEFTPAVQAALQPTLKKSSYGLSVQVGMDYEISKNFFLNLDAKKVQIGTDVSSFGNKVGEFKVNPWLIGGGVGWRF